MPMSPSQLRFYTIGLLVCLLLPFLGQAQGETTWWYFGGGAGTHYTCDDAIKLGGPLSAIEGSSAMSTPDGELLFYTNGIVIRDRNHNLMPNGTGLLGHVSSSQSATIVPWPGDTTKYFVFTIDASPQWSSVGVHYSVVDMTLNGGLGDIGPTKNVYLTHGIERLAAVRHGNAKDYWVVTTEDTIRAFQVTNAGVNHTPVESATVTFPWAGLSKFSPNGKFLAVPGAGLYDFDDLTGIASNQRDLMPLWYGIAFSPNSQYLYTAQWTSIYQYDITLGTQAAIQASSVNLGSASTQVDGMQLAPNGKIYCSRQHAWLSTIEFPNNPGGSCVMVDSGYLCLPPKHGFSGMPNFVQTYLHTPQLICADSICLGDSTRLTIMIDNSDSVYWDFGDPGSGVNNFSTKRSPAHVFSDSGTYRIKLYTHFPNFIDTAYKTLRILAPPQIDLGADTTFCPGDTLVLNGSFAEATYIWQDSSTDAKFNLDTAGINWVEVTNACGMDRDTLVSALFSVTVDLGPDSFLCGNDSFLLQTSVSNGIYLWQDSSTASSIMVSDPGTYWVEATNICGVFTDTLELLVAPFPIATAGADTTICLGDTLYADSVSWAFNLNWSSGDSTNWFIPDTTGTYRLVAFNPCASDTDYVHVTVDLMLVPQLGADTFLCTNESITISTGLPSGSFTWNDNSSDSSKVLSNPGQWIATVDNICHFVSDTITIDSLPSPFVYLGFDTSMCENFQTLLDATFPDAVYLWQDSSANSIFVVSEQGQYFVTIVSPCGQATDTIDITYHDTLDINLGVDTTICEGDTILLETLIDTLFPHFWQNGSNFNSFHVLISGNYWVMVNNACGQFGDTIVVEFDQHPVIDLGPDQTTCSSNPVTLNASWTNAEYVWSSGDTTASIQPTTSGLYQVTVTGYCSQVSDTVQITYEDSIVLSLPDSLPRCPQSMNTLESNVQVPASLLWNTGSVASSIILDTTGIFWLEATNTCGTFSDSVLVFPQALPLVSISPDAVICPGDSIALTADAGSLPFVWQDGSVSPNFTARDAGEYSVLAENECGSTRLSTFVALQEEPSVDFGEDRLICPGETVVLQIDAPLVVPTWPDLSHGSTFSVIDSGLVSVDLSDSLGCLWNKQVHFELCPLLWIPNAFTPNSNGRNDVFRPQGIDQADRYRFKIYNRWGEMIFSSSDPLTGWNGTLEGKPAQPGVYVWQVSFINRFLREITETGEVHLIR